MSKILVTGGLGYIGSHTTVELLAAGYEIAVIDSLINSVEEVTHRIEQISGKKISVYIGDIRDRDFLHEVFEAEKPEAVIHFAALKSVAGSYAAADEYRSVNVGGTEALCEVMREYGVNKLVFSSSACVYGAPEITPTPESARLQPNNPYGETKVACEELLSAYAAGHGWSVVMLRYFNPVGAHPSGLIGEFPKNAENIAPIIAEVLRGVRPVMRINGDDHPTPDGTPVRDYIHIVDLALAHVASLAHVFSHDGVHIYNVGTGQGCSVRELIYAFEEAAHKTIPIEFGPHRAGDVATVVADVSKINSEVGWHATRSVADMAQSAVHWLNLNPNGFETYGGNSGINH